MCEKKNDHRNKVIYIILISYQAKEICKSSVFLHTSQYKFTEHGIHSMLCEFVIRSVQDFFSFLNVQIGKAYRLKKKIFEKNNTSFWYDETYTYIHIYNMHICNTTKQLVHLEAYER